MDESTAVMVSFSSKPLHKCPKCDRTFGNIGHMKCHFYRVHPEFRLAEFELPEVVQQTIHKEKPEALRPQQPKRTPESKPAPPVHQIPLTKIHQMLSKCDKCNKCFTNKTSLLKHSVSVHGDIERPFACTTCDKCFQTAARLRSHMETHARGRPSPDFKKSPSKARSKKKRYICKVCQRGFQYRSSLKKHVLAHEAEEEDPFECTVCQETFELQSDLDAHARSHSSEYETEQPLDLRDAPVRLYHRKGVHKDQNRVSHVASRLKCEICDKVFARPCNLARHATMHKLDADQS